MKENQKKWEKFWKKMQFFKRSMERPKFYEKDFMIKISNWKEKIKN